MDKLSKRFSLWWFMLICTVLCSCSIVKAGDAMAEGEMEVKTENNIETIFGDANSTMQKFDVDG